MDPNVVMADCYQLGAEKIYPMTASHGKGIKTLLDDIFVTLPPYTAPSVLEGGIRIAVVGRPNVGKSTLVNRMLGEDRVVVYDQPGTTRDSIYIKYERDGEPYTLIDTAGVRRRKNVSETVEKFSIVKTLKAIADANVVVLMMDATENIVDQDLHLLGTVIDAGRALVLAVNKWDGLEVDQKNQIKSEIDRKLRFIDFAELHFISALHGTGVGHLYESIHAAFASSMEKFQTSKLTEILEESVALHPPPMINGRRIKLRYAHLGGSNPPIIVVHGNQTDKVPASFKRYLEKAYRKELNLVGTPLRVEFKGSENPYEGKKNKLNQRQIKNKKRLVKFVKKKDAKKKKKR
jgi:GTP-binding protein